ncbi:aminotransferase class V-fold PLP-dependent enzyme [Anaerococcus porci]|uniref:Cysteine desulfurase n=1 Tax=Anaerococcus porci TaxID=2652269 RepID=A0A6N7VXE4_9FIRM|nr:cysteine desulfurase [Anaerococcus porci]MDY3006919.1 cysteine desulfurase [Anaerococcus porci]MSS78527.1 cysteine desulfurase [Anaerococcus porci]
MNIEKIRNEFPFLDAEKTGKKVIYLDSAATSQKPLSVINAQADYYKYSNANPHRGSHYLSWKATEVYEKTREKIRNFINANRPEEIIYTRNATESLNLLAYSYASENLKEGDEILISILEHHANLVPWQRVAKEKGAVLKYVYLNEDFSLDYNQLRDKITNKTKIVAITASSNVTGEMTDVKKITKLAHEVGAISIVDACQLAAHKAIDVKDIDCDFLAFSGHKMYAPLGIGILFGKYSLLENLKPYNLGGDMIEYVYEQESTFAKPAQRFEAGTQDVGGVVGLSAAIDFINEIGIDNIYEHENELVRYAYDLIKDIDNIKIFFPEKRNTGSVLSFAFCDIHPHDIASILDMNGIAVRSGHHCAMPLHTYLGVSSTCRASFAIYNTKEEVEYFAKELKNVRKVMGL